MANRGGRRAERVALAMVAGAGMLCAVAAGAQGPTRVRVRGDSLRIAQIDTLRDSTMLRISINGDAIGRLIRELMASKELEQTIGYALRESATGLRTDTHKMQELRDKLDELARRNAGMMSTIQMQCEREGPLPEGYLGVSFEQTRISQRDDEPAMWKFGAVETVTPGSPAEKAGIQSGDVLLAIGGLDARKEIALANLLKTGARLPVRLQRGRTTKDITVVVEKRPQQFGSDCATVERLIGPERDALRIFRRAQSLPVAPRVQVERRAADPGVPATVYVTPVPPVPPMAGGFGYLYEVGTRTVAGMQVMPLDEDWRQSLGVDNGLLVMKVGPGTPAKDAGLRGNDVITAADDQPVSSVGALQRILGFSKTGTLKLQVIRAGKPQTITLRWQERER